MELMFSILEEIMKAEYVWYVMNRSYNATMSLKTIDTIS